MDLGIDKNKDIASHFSEDLHKAAASEILKEEQAELIKGKALPVGTTRKWNGITYIKTNDGWKVKAEGSKSKKKDSDKKKPAKEESSSSNKGSDKEFLDKKHPYGGTYGSRVERFVESTKDQIGKDGKPKDIKAAIKELRENAEVRRSIDDNDEAKVMDLVADKLEGKKPSSETKKTESTDISDLQAGDMIADSVLGMDIQKYSDKAVLVTGDTKENLDTLRDVKKETGVGNWNKKLGGLVFPLTKVGSLLGAILGKDDGQGAESSPEEAEQKNNMQELKNAYTVGKVVDFGGKPAVISGVSHNGNTVTYSVAQGKETHNDLTEADFTAKPETDQNKVSQSILNVDPSTRTRATKEIMGDASVAIKEQELDQAKDKSVVVDLQGKRDLMVKRLKNLMSGKKSSDGGEKKKVETKKKETESKKKDSGEKKNKSGLSRADLDKSLTENNMMSVTQYYQALYGEMPGDPDARSKAMMGNQNAKKDGLDSSYNLKYTLSDDAKKGRVKYEVRNSKGDTLGMVEYHKSDNSYIEIDRIYLDKNQQKKGYGQKILMDILNDTNSKGFELYPLDSTPWIKMGMVFKEDKEYLTITKDSFVTNNKEKLNVSEESSKEPVDPSKRSDAMKGNQNAKKDGKPEDESKKQPAKKEESPLDQMIDDNAQEIVDSILDKNYTKEYLINYARHIVNDSSKYEGTVKQLRLATAQKLLNAASKMEEEKKPETKPTADVEVERGEEIPGLDYGYKVYESKVKTITGKEWTVQDHMELPPKEIKQFNVKNILDSPKPNYIPEINMSSFKYLRGWLTATEDPNDRNALIVKSPGQVNKLTGQRGEEVYLKMSREHYMSTMSYYQTKLKAEAKKESQEQHERRVARWKESYPGKELPKSWSKPKVRRLSFAGPKQVFQPDLSMRNELYMNDGRTNTIKDVQQMKETNQIAMNNMSIAIEDYSNAYAKGKETSYGETGAKDTIMDTHGVKIKNQNGKEMSKADIDFVTSKMDEVYSVFGNRSSMAKEWNLKISNAGDVHQHASKALGIFMPAFKAIGVSKMYGDNKGGFTLGHEFAHFMDYYLAEKTGDKRKFVSHDSNHVAGQIADAFRDNLNLGGLKNNKYFGSSHECFARAFEQYQAMTTYGDDVMKIDGKYTEAPEQVDAKNFNEKVKPLIEKFLKDNDKLLKSMELNIIQMDALEVLGVKG